MQKNFATLLIEFYYADLIDHSLFYSIFKFIFGPIFMGRSEEKRSKSKKHSSKGGSKKSE